MLTTTTVSECLDSGQYRELADSIVVVVIELEAMVADRVHIAIAGCNILPAIGAVMRICVKRGHCRQDSLTKRKLKAFPYPNQ